MFKRVRANSILIDPQRNAEVVKLLFRLESVKSSIRVNLTKNNNFKYK